MAAKRQKDNTNKLVYFALTTADGWGEIDRSDIVNMKILPAIIKSMNKDSSDSYSEDLWDAVSSVKRHGLYDKLYKLFDKAIIANKDGKSFSDWADKKEEDYNELVN